MPDPQTVISLTGWQMLGVLGFFAIWTLIASGVPALLAFREYRARVRGKDIQNRADQLKLDGEEMSMPDMLKAKIATMIRESVEAMKREQELKAEIAAKNILIEIKDGQIEKYQELMEGIVEDRGRALERESICQDRLKDIELELEEVKRQLGSKFERELARTNKALAIENLQLKGENGSNETTAGGPVGEPETT